MMVSKTGRYREQILLGWAVWSISLGLISTLEVGQSFARTVGASLPFS